MSGVLLRVYKDAPTFAQAPAPSSLQPRWSLRQKLFEGLDERVGPRVVEQQPVVGTVEKHEAPARDGGSDGAATIERAQLVVTAVHDERRRRDARPAQPGRAE